MSEIAQEKARSAWLLTFGDVVTLLITFFILAIALNKGEITQVQKWAEEQIDISFTGLIEDEDDFEFLTIHRTSLGIEILIEDSTGFEKGGFEPALRLRLELQALARVLNDLPLFQMSYEKMPSHIQQQVNRNNLKWRVDVGVAGHTDNDRIDPRTPMKNNWFLSTMRAQSVMAILEDNMTLDKSFFSVSGYGKHRPIVANDTPNNKAQNRRVDIVISATLEERAETTPTVTLYPALISNSLTPPIAE